MKPSEIIDRIVNEGKLEDKSIGTLTDWIVENQGKETVSMYVSAIDEDEILDLTPEGKKRGKIFIKKLKFWNFFNGLGIKYSERGWFKESEQIFEAILKRTPNDVDSILNYGAATFNMILALYNQGKGVDKNQIEKARSLIFEAYRYDTEVHEDWRIKPAYKNLCYLRAIEAAFYYNQKELLTAFVLGWMSIELSLYRIWFQFVIKKVTEGIDELMNWNTEHIIEALFLSDIDGTFKGIKSDLDILKGIRHKLLHGKINNPTPGNAKFCIDTALKIIPILQSL
jgi:hypothetical protein